MTDVAIRWRAARHSYYWVLWLALLALAFLLTLHPELFGWAVKYPRALVVPFGKWIGEVVKWCVDHLQPFTRALAAIMDAPLRLVQALLAKGFIHNGQEEIFPRFSWLGVIGAFTLAGFAYGGIRVAVLSFVCFAYVALFGQWDSTMLTLASVIICAPFGVAVGMLLGILAYRVPLIDTWFIRPTLDISQTMPAFAYLVPILLLFGSGPVPALVATIIFAAPPMVRATKLALEQVPEEIQSFADMSGCTRRQKLWRVMVPTAQPLLMVGVNQVIMMTLNMVIIASMIGAGGLGYDVLMALRQLDVDKGLVAGSAIIVVAVSLDRISAAAAKKTFLPLPPGASFRQRHPYLILSVLWLAVTTLLGFVLPAFAHIPPEWTVKSGTTFMDLVKWINVNFFDTIDAGRTWLLLNFLNPIKAFLVDLPWVFVVSAIGLLGYQLAGWRLALLVTLLMLFCAVTGLWEKTMITVYLCSISALIAAVIGMALGAWGARNEALNRVLVVVVDTLQTLPGFVYLIPAVMLLRIGDVAAMIAIVLFAVAPAIRYTTHGIRQVPPHLLEASAAMGCTRRQMFWRVQLPLALPEIMLGINQTVLMALSMLVITSLVGTRDLGLEVFVSLAKADGGRGIVAGLCVAFLGIVADRLIVAGARRTRRRLGLLDA